MQPSQNNLTPVKPTDNNQPSDADKRNGLRHPSRVETHCTVRIPDSERVFQSWAYNISITGVAILLQELFEPGAVMQIELVTADGRIRQVKDAVVRHSFICFPNDSWLHGCEFTQPPTEFELQAFGQVKQD